MFTKPLPETTPKDIQRFAELIGVTTESFVSALKSLTPVFQNAVSSMNAFSLSAETLEPIIDESDQLVDDPH